MKFHSPSTCDIDVLYRYILNIPWSLMNGYCAEDGVDTNLEMDVFVCI